MRTRQIWIGLLFAAITIALWLSVGLNNRFQQDTILANFNLNQMALVKNIAAASQGWMELRQPAGASQSQVLQEVIQRFINPVHLLQDSSVWIYHGGSLEYDSSPDFPAEYLGKSIEKIFELQNQKGASHYADLVTGIMNAAESSGWYVWQPSTGRQYTAWTSVSLAGEPWTFGISTPETEILAFSGSQQSLQRELFGASLITLLLWGVYFIALRIQQLADSQLKVLERSVSDQSVLAQRVTSQSAELAQANADLQKASTARDEFLSTMGHELRTPLSTIIGLTYAMQCQVYGPVTEKQSASLETILSTTRHLSTLLNDILDLSQIQSGKMKLEVRPVSLSSLLDACMVFVDQQAFRKNIKVSFDRDPKVEWIEGDETRLKQLLFNLLNNAAKFTPAEGQVGVEVKGDLPEKRVEITVWDTGIGIAASDLPRLFKPFVQLDAGIGRQYGGTGLGLSLVLRIAELHGGSITVLSEAGKGSRFTIALPWRGNEFMEPVEESTQIIHDLEEIVRPEIASTIMIIDDEMQSRQLVADFLTAVGYEVILAGDGKSALGRYKERKPRLILVDLHLPDMDGFELIRQLRFASEAGTVPIVAINTLELPGDRDAALQAGANDYVKEPLPLEKVAALVHALLANTGRANNS